MSKQALLEKPSEELMLPVGKTEKLLEATNDEDTLSLIDQRILLVAKIDYLTEELADSAKTDQAKENIQGRIDNATDKLAATEHQILGNVAVKFE